MSLRAESDRRVRRSPGIRGLAFWGALASSACAPAPDEASDSVGPTHAEPQLLASGDTSSTGPSIAALVAAPPRTARTIAALMFDIGGGPPNESMITTLLKGETGSLTAMYREISYGMQDLQIDVYGPYTLDEQTCLPIECCGPKTNQPNGPQVQGIIADLPKTYDHYFWVYGQQPPGANCGTWGDEGRPGTYAKYSSYSFHSIVGYTQELGHNFGMTHEPIMKCPNNATLPDDPSTCTHSEYGSTLSFMGSGGHHTSAYHKVAQGWLSGCNGVKVGGSGTYTLLPVEVPCDGTQVLQIPAPKTRSAPMAGDRQGQAPMLTHYYLELRTPRGFDSTYQPQVFVSIGPDFNSSRAAPYVYQLNRTPDTQDRPDLKDGGYGAGQTFTDPGGGLSFTVDSIDESAAQVTVTATATGSDTCLDGSAFTGPGPGFESCDANGASGSGGMGGTSGSAAGAAGGNGGRASGGAGAGGAGAGGAGMGVPAGAGGAPSAGGAGKTTGDSGSGGGGAGAVATGGLGGRSGGAGSGAFAGTSSGSGGAAAGRSNVAGTGGSAGMGVAAAPVAPSQEDAGCGCRTADDSSPRYGSAWASAFSALLLAARARRRRRMQATSSAVAT